MSQDIFNSWFNDVFVPLVRAHLKEIGLPTEAMLFMDNSPTHPNSQLQSDDGKITCHFLPANTTALIQPMDQGVIETMKRRYRKQFIQQLATFGEEINVKDFWKRYTIKDTVFNITQAWNDLSHLTLKRAWNKLCPQENDEDNNDGENNNIGNENILQMCETLPTEEKIEINDVAKWMDIDKLDAGFEFLSDDELIQQALNENGPEENDESEQEFEEPTKTITHAEAESMLSKCFEWFE